MLAEANNIGYHDGAAPSSSDMLALLGAFTSLASSPHRSLLITCACQFSLIYSMHDKTLVNSCLTKEPNRQSQKVQYSPIPAFQKQLSATR